MQPISNLENQQFRVLNPVEVDAACEDLRKELAKMNWVSHPFHIAQRFYEKDKATSQTHYYPEIYVSSGQDVNDRYIRLTPDNKLKGLFFFVVSSGKENGDGFMTYNVGIIFSANLELIDPAKYKNYLFTQELIAQARKILKGCEYNFDFKFEIKEETRDTRDTFKEFTVDDSNQYNRAPMQCFRFNLTMTVEISCQ